MHWVHTNCWSVCGPVRVYWLCVVARCVANYLAAYVPAYHLCALCAEWIVRVSVFTLQFALVVFAFLFCDFVRVLCAHRLRAVVVLLFFLFCHRGPAKVFQTFVVLFAQSIFHSSWSSSQVCTTCIHGCMYGLMLQCAEEGESPRWDPWWLCMGYCKSVTGICSKCHQSMHFCWNQLHVSSETRKVEPLLYYDEVQLQSVALLQVPPQRRNLHWPGGHSEKPVLDCFQPCVGLTRKSKTSN